MAARMLVLTLLLAAGCSKAVDVRSRLLESARSQDPDFPDGVEVQLVRFAYLGYVTTPDGPVHVVSRHEVIRGMLAPRGRSKLDLYDRHHDLLASYWWPSGPPLWCEGSKIYLWGCALEGPVPVDPAIRPLFGNDECPGGNVLDLSEGLAGAVLRMEKRYGSSGGIEDDPLAQLRKRAAAR